MKDLPSAPRARRPPPASSAYWLALVLLFAAGFLELSFNTMAQTLVQLRAPAHIRGRVIGLYQMGALGMRAFSGVTIGVVGGLIGIHWLMPVLECAVALEPGRKFAEACAGR